MVRKAVGTPVQLGIGGTLTGWPIAIFLIGLLILIALFVRKVKGAMLIAILGATVLAVIVEAVAQDRLPHGRHRRGREPDRLDAERADAVAASACPNLGLLGRVDLFGGFTRAAGPARDPRPAAAGLLAAAE